jgi:hypothetical protein
MTALNIASVKYLGDKLITVLTVSSALGRAGLSVTSNYRQVLQFTKHGVQPTTP